MVELCLPLVFVCSTSTINKCGGEIGSCWVGICLRLSCVFSVSTINGFSVYICSCCCKLLSPWSCKSPWARLLTGILSWKIICFRSFLSGFRRWVISSTWHCIKGNHFFFVFREIQTLSVAWVEKERQKCSKQTNRKKKVGVDWNDLCLCFSKDHQQGNIWTGLLLCLPWRWKAASPSLEINQSEARQGSGQPDLVEDLPGDCRVGWTGWASGITSNPDHSMIPMLLVFMVPLHLVLIAWKQGIARNQGISRLKNRYLWE